MAVDGFFQRHLGEQNTSGGEISRHEIFEVEIASGGERESLIHELETQRLLRPGRGRGRGGWRRTDRQCGARQHGGAEKYPARGLVS